MANGDSARSSRPLGLTILHWVIIVHFAIEIAYAGYMTMVVLRAPGAGIAPLGSAALTLDPSLFLKRRAYAIENWIATGGLAVYLAITEIGPRFWLRAMLAKGQSK